MLNMINTETTKWGIYHMTRKIQINIVCLNIWSIPIIFILEKGISTYHIGPAVQIYVPHT